MFGFDGITFAVFAALGALSLVATSVTFYKIIQLARLGLGRRRKMAPVFEACAHGQTDQAIRALGNAKGVLPRVLGATLAGLRHKPGDTVYAEEIGRQAALGELSRLSRQMRLLESVVQAAPMLGLLGTVIGMIDAFAKLSEASGAVDPALLAGGIYTALTTTAAGLTIAIIFYFVANWLEARIENERLDMEMAISAAIHGPAAQGAAGPGTA